MQKTPNHSDDVPEPQPRAATFLGICLFCALTGLVSGVSCAFWMNSYLSPTLRAAANSCAPVTQEIAKEQDDTLNHALALKQAERLLSAQSKIIDARVARGGVPVQSHENGNIVDCKKGPE
jgi:hypothetical protein